jgi:hypothetical protein
VQPLTFDRSLAVRYLHSEAKSAERTRFDREYATKVAPQLRRRLTWWERAADVPFRAQYRIRARLGLLGVRERWFGGRFARR